MTKHSYRVGATFETETELPLSELVSLVRLLEDSIKFGRPSCFEVTDLEVEGWMGENPVGGLNPPTDNLHAYLVWYEYFAKGNEGTTVQESDDLDWHCFGTEEEAEALAQEWLAPEAWEEGSRVAVTIRWVSFPAWAVGFLNDDVRDIPVEDFNDWLSDEVWREERRVGERRRLWLAR
jgi:hypothetical protein